MSNPKYPYLDTGATRADILLVGRRSDADEARITSNAGLVVSTTPAPTDLSTMTGNVTLTAAQLLKGVVHGDPGGADRTLTTPTAAEIVAAFDEKIAGLSFDFSVINQANADENIVLTAGTNVTIVGSATVEAYVAANLNSSSALFRVRITSVGATPTVSIYRIS